MQKKTAVEWLVEQVNADCLNSTFIRKELIDQAKTIEREQIEDSYAHGQNNGYMYAHSKAITISKENYYNSTFKGGEQ